MATYTGWTFVARPWAGTNFLVSLMGLAIPFRDESRPRARLFTPLG